MSRIRSPRAIVEITRLVVTASCVLSLGGCGSTIVTRIHSRDVVRSLPIDKRENQARRLEKQLEILPTKSGDWRASAAALVLWAGRDAERLTLAAESLLLAHARGSREISGFSIAAMDLSWRSLRSSGVPPPQWLETPATRRTIAIYNTVLDRFLAIHGSDLARGRTDIFWTPLGGMEVSTEFVARAPYRAGYFDTFILADHVGIRGMGKRVQKKGPRRGPGGFARANA